MVYSVSSQGLLSSSTSIPSPSLSSRGRSSPGKDENSPPPPGTASTSSTTSASGSVGLVAPSSGHNLLTTAPGAGATMAAIATPPATRGVSKIRPPEAGRAGLLSAGRSPAHGGDGSSVAVGAVGGAFSTSGSGNVVDGGDGDGAGSDDVPPALSLPGTSPRATDAFAVDDSGSASRDGNGKGLRGLRRVSEGNDISAAFLAAGANGSIDDSSSGSNRFGERSLFGAEVDKGKGIGAVGVGWTPTASGLKGKNRSFSPAQSAVSSAASTPARLKTPTRRHTSSGLTSPRLMPPAPPEHDRISVACRIKPRDVGNDGIADGGVSGGAKAAKFVCASVGGDEKTVGWAGERADGGGTRLFTFDYAAGETVGQEELFEKIGRPVTNACLEGYNGTIFCYGQTGSGKTFTTFGPPDDADAQKQASVAQGTEADHPLGGSAGANRGLVPRVLEYLFERFSGAAQARKEEESGECNPSEIYICRCSFYEIHNEHVYDLAVPEEEKVSLNIREAADKGIFLEGLSEEEVKNAHDACEVLRKGYASRHTASTAMNSASSRSHAVFTLVVDTAVQMEAGGASASAASGGRQRATPGKGDSKASGGTVRVRSSRFNLVDLAGSERQSRTNAKGAQLKDAASINKSLSALGRVINSLVEGAGAGHVPYRDSKLTRLLAHSLGGNSKTVLVATVSSGALNAGETLSTLKFVQRAKMIKNKAVRNEATHGGTLALKEENEGLRRLIDDQGQFLLQAKSRLEEADSHRARLAMEVVALRQEARKNKDTAVEATELLGEREHKLEELQQVLKVKETELAEAASASPKFGPRWSNPAIIGHSRRVSSGGSSSNCAVSLHSSSHRYGARERRRARRRSFGDVNPPSPASPQPELPLMLRTPGTARRRRGGGRGVSYVSAAGAGGAGNGGSKSGCSSAVSSAIRRDTGGWGQGRSRSESDGSASTSGYFCSDSARSGAEMDDGDDDLVQGVGTGPATDEAGFGSLKGAETLLYTYREAASKLERGEGDDEDGVKYSDVEDDDDDEDEEDVKVLWTLRDDEQPTEMGPALSTAAASSVNVAPPSVRADSHCSRDRVDLDGDPLPLAAQESKPEISADERRPFDISPATQKGLVVEVPDTPKHDDHQAQSANLSQQDEQSEGQEGRSPQQQQQQQQEQQPRGASEVNAFEGAGPSMSPTPQVVVTRSLLRPSVSSIPSPSTYDDEDIGFDEGEYFQESSAVDVNKMEQIDGDGVDASCVKDTEGEGAASAVASAAAVVVASASVAAVSVAALGIAAVAPVAAAGAAAVGVGVGVAAVASAGGSASGSSSGADEGRGEAENDVRDSGRLSLVISPDTSPVEANAVVVDGRDTSVGGGVSADEEHDGDAISVAKMSVMNGVIGDDMLHGRHFGGIGKAVYTSGGGESSAIGSTDTAAGSGGEGDYVQSPSHPIRRRPPDIADGVHRDVVDSTAFAAVSEGGGDDNGLARLLLASDDGEDDGGSSLGRGSFPGMGFQAWSGVDCDRPFGDELLAAGDAVGIVELVSGEQPVKACEAGGSEQFIAAAQPLRSTQPLASEADGRKSGSGSGEPSRGGGGFHESSHIGESGQVHDGGGNNDDGNDDSDHDGDDERTRASGQAGGSPSSTDTSSSSSTASHPRLAMLSSHSTIASSLDGTGCGNADGSGSAISETRTPTFRRAMETYDRLEEGNSSQPAGSPHEGLMSESTANADMSMDGARGSAREETDEAGAVSIAGADGVITSASVATNGFAHERSHPGSFGNAREKSECRENTTADQFGGVALETPKFLTSSSGSHGEGGLPQDLLPSEEGAECRAPSRKRAPTGTTAHESGGLGGGDTISSESLERHSFRKASADLLYPDRGQSRLFRLPRGDAEGSGASSRRASHGVGDEYDELSSCSTSDQSDMAGPLTSEEVTSALAAATAIVLPHGTAALSAAPGAGAAARSKSAGDSSGGLFRSSSVLEMPIRGGVGSSGGVDDVIPDAGFGKVFTPGTVKARAEAAEARLRERSAVAAAPALAGNPGDGSVGAATGTAAAVGRSAPIAEKSGQSPALPSATHETVAVTSSCSAASLPTGPSATNPRPAEAAPIDSSCVLPSTAIRTPARALGTPSLRPPVWPARPTLVSGSSLLALTERPLERDAHSLERDAHYGAHEADNDDQQDRKESEPREHQPQSQTAYSALTKGALYAPVRSGGPIAPSTAIDRRALTKAQGLARFDPQERRGWEGGGQRREGGNAVRGSDRADEKSMAVAEGFERGGAAALLAGVIEMLREQSDIRDAMAEPCLRRCLEIHEKLYGPDHPEVAKDLANLAEVLQDKGEIERAEPLHRRALEIRLSYLGPTHKDVAHSLHNLSLICRTKGHLMEADRLLSRANSIWERAYTSRGDMGESTSEGAGAAGCATGEAEASTPGAPGRGRGLSFDAVSSAGTRPGFTRNPIFVPAAFGADRWPWEQLGRQKSSRHDGYASS